MIRVLICGKGSYIGSAFIDKMSNIFEIDELDLQNEEWERFDFSGYDALIHLAAIVHRPEEEDKELYFSVNRDLPFKVATRAISQGLKHFIFFSTMAVHGKGPSMTGNGRLSINSNYSPESLYGRSKLEAEMKLVDLHAKSNFILTIIRPPNVYGENCPGNYYRYMKLCAKYLLIFPLLRHNKFSMISISQLCDVMGEAIENQTSFLICPQEDSDMSNASRIQKMAKHYGRFHYQSKLFGKLLMLLYKIYPFKQITNFFGDMYYDESLSNPIPIDRITYLDLEV